MAKQAGLLEKLSKTFRGIDKSTQGGFKEARKGWRKAERQLTRLISVSEGARKAMSDALTIHELALTRGTELGGFLERSADNIENLSDGMTGYGTSLQVAADAFDAGLDSNNQAMGRLLLSNKLTEKQSKQLAKSIRENTIGLGFSDEQMGNLADTTLMLRQTYGLTTRELQSAISALGDRLADFGALGIGEEASEAAMLLGSVIGKGGEKMAADLLAAVTAGDKLGQMSALGVGKERQKFLSGEGDVLQNAVSLFSAVGKAIENKTGQFTKDQKDRMLMVKAMSNIFGINMTKHLRAWKEFEKGLAGRTDAELVEKLKMLQVQKEISDNFTSTWENVKAKILGPLQKMITGWMEKLLEFAKDPRFDSIVKTVGKLVVALGALSLISPFLGPIKGIALGLGKMGIQLAANTAALLLSPLTGMMKGIGIGAKKGGKKGGGNPIALVLGAIKGAWMGLLSGFKGIFFGALKLVGAFFFKALIMVPVFGLILMAISSIVMLVKKYSKEIGAFMKPIIDFFQPIYRYFVEGYHQVQAAFEKGFWEGIYKLGEYMAGLPMMIAKFIGLKLQKLWWILREEWAVSKEARKTAKYQLQAIRTLEAAAKDEHRFKMMERQDAADARAAEAIASKAHKAALDKQAREDAERAKTETTNELLERINKAMDVESLRRAYALELQEKQASDQQQMVEELQKPNRTESHEIRGA